MLLVKHKQSRMQTCATRAHGLTGHGKSNTREDARGEQTESRDCAYGEAHVVCRLLSANMLETALRPGPGQLAGASNNYHSAGSGKRLLSSASEKAEARRGRLTGLLGRGWPGV